MRQTLEPISKAISRPNQFDREAEGSILQVRMVKTRQRFKNTFSTATGLIQRRVESEKPLEVLTSELNTFIALELSLVPEVEYVYTAFRNDVFYIWVVTDHFEESVRHRVYEREKAIIDEFPMFEFDFYLVAKTEDQDVAELISEAITLAYTRRRS